MGLVGGLAPKFQVDAVINGGETVQDFSLDQFLNKKYVILFFYPKDFTFVCPSELHAFQSKLHEFHKRDCEIIGCSTDTAETHWGWLQMPKEKGGIKGITYPLIADGNKVVSDAYDVLNGEYDYNEEGELIASSNMIAYRGLFLIDKEGVVQHQLVNNLPLGRNVDEAIRILDALKFHEKNGEVCPANWQAGDVGMKDTHEGVADYLSSH
jgi:peroxiredoxin (alkyl hydroperoxide reductase subunit C)|tara:strand:- start:5552 stop:6181 length:630 start_codon:yes stop_codon:yes gene_type:complete